MIQNTNYGASKTYVNTKVDKLTTSGLKAYTHDGATQGEIEVSNTYTPSTLALRDSNGRIQAADPASGATDKTLVTANWVSQSGNASPNNLVHKNGREVIEDLKQFHYPLDASGLFRAITRAGASIDPTVYYLVLKVKAENGVIMNLSLTSDRYNYITAHFKADITLRLSATAGKAFVNSIRASSVTAANGWKCVTATKDNYVYLFTNNPNIQYSVTCVSIITYGSYASETNQPNTTNIEYGDQNVTYVYPTSPEYSDISDSVNSVVVL